MPYDLPWWAGVAAGHQVALRQVVVGALGTREHVGIRLAGLAVVAFRARDGVRGVEGAVESRRTVLARRAARLILVLAGGAGGGLRRAGQAVVTCGHAEKQFLKVQEAWRE